MKIAYLIDKEAIGGGGEYIRRKIAALPDGDEGRAFYADRGECTWKALREWGAEKVVINHLRAAVQLFNPLRGGVRARRITTVFVVHGIHLRKFDWLPKTIANRVKRELRRRLESWIYHRCDRVVALTETDRNDILKLYGNDLNVIVEPNTLEGWVEARVARAVLSTAVATDREVREGEFKYICIGRFDFQKGQDRWIRGVSEKVKVKSEKVGRTLFIGDGPTLAGCKQLANDLDVEELFEFAGAIPDADRYLKCADIVVSPSRWEGMPYLLMKARALGCQVLATDCPGNRDVLGGYDRWEKLEL